MPGNAALHEPVDLQSEHPSMNSATFCRFLHSKFKTSFILDCTCKFLDYSSQLNFILQMF